MATIDLTLDSFKVPAIENYTPPFGTKIVKTDANKGGLSTVEVNSNIMMPFANMRPKIITENSSTTEIEYDAKLCFSSSLLAGATLELDDGAYEGCRVQITNLSSFACDVEYNSATLVSIPTGANVEVLWTGSSWMLSTTGTIASGNVMPPSSSAVHAAIAQYGQDQNELSEIENFSMTKNTGVTVPYDGFIHVCVALGGGKGCYFYKSTNNGNTWTEYYTYMIGSESSARNTMTVYVQKGEFVKWSTDTSWGGLQYIKAQWFKKRDYSGRS